MILLSKMAQALKIDTEELKTVFCNGVQSMRMNYYPPCPEPEMAIGFTPHSDADALTILYQLNETDGLQIRKDGNWVAVKPLENAFVVNIGDMMEVNHVVLYKRKEILCSKYSSSSIRDMFLLQIIKNGEYRSIEHRAVVNSEKERLSVATFYSSNIDSELGPAPGLITPQNPPVFRRMPTEEYFKVFFARKLNGKSYLDFMRIDDGEIIS